MLVKQTIGKTRRNSGVRPVPAGPAASPRRLGCTGSEGEGKARGAARVSGARRARGAAASTPRRGGPGREELLLPRRERKGLELRTADSSWPPRPASSVLSGSLPFFPPAAKPQQPRVGATRGVPRPGALCKKFVFPPPTASVRPAGILRPGELRTRSAPGKEGFLGIAALKIQAPDPRGEEVDPRSCPGSARAEPATSQGADPGPGGLQPRKPVSGWRGARSATHPARSCSCTCPRCAPRFCPPGRSRDRGTA